MNEITLPYHLFIPTIISVLALGIIFYNRNQLLKIGKWKWFWRSTTVFFAIYLLIVGGATYSDLYAQWNINKYDLNGDGVFSPGEINPDQKAAMENLISDTGRNLSFIIGLFFSGIIALFVLIAGKVIERINR